MVDVRAIEKIQLMEFKFHLLAVVNKYRMLIKVKDGKPIVVRTSKKTKLMDADFIDDDEMRLELFPITVEKNESTRKANKIRSKLSQ